MCKKWNECKREDCTPRDEFQRSNDRSIKEEHSYSYCSIKDDEDDGESAEECDEHWWKDEEWRPVVEHE